MISHRERSSGVPAPAVALTGLLFICLLTLWVPNFPLAHVFLAGVFVVTLAAALQNKAPQQSRITWMALSAVAFLPLWSLVQVLVSFSVYPTKSLLGVFAALAFLCVAFVASGIPARSVDRVRLVLLWFAFIVAVLAILQNLTSVQKVFWIFFAPDAGSDFMGPFIYHNHWAVFVEIALPFAIYQALRAYGGRVWLYAAMAAALYGSVVVSASRSGVIVCTLEIVAVALLTGREQRMEAGAIRALAAFFAVVVLGVFIAGPDTVLRRFATDTSGGRADWNQTSLVMFQARPWQGFGLGNWPIVYTQFAHFDPGVFVNQAHNDWLQWAVEGGVPYLLAWLVIAAVAVRQAWRFPWAAGVPAVFCQALMDYPFARPALAGWVFFVFGMSLAAGKRERR